MSNDKDKSDGPSAEDLRSVMADRLREAAHLAVKAPPAGETDFGLSAGPEVPDLATAREDLAVRNAAADLEAAARGLGAVRGVVALIEAAAGLAGVTLD